MNSRLREFIEVYSSQVGYTRLAMTDPAMTE